MDLSFNFPAHPEIEFARPSNLDEMLRFAQILSQDEPFVRIDFYSASGKTYVGEITFFPASGYEKFVPAQNDRYFGDKIVYASQTLNGVPQSNRRMKTR
jgi:hypothetical protein